VSDAVALPCASALLLKASMAMQAAGRHHLPHVKFIRPPEKDLQIEQKFKRSQFVTLLLPYSIVNRQESPVLH
jgi:hypothetical protein